MLLFAETIQQVVLLYLKTVENILLTLTSCEP